MAVIGLIFIFVILLALIFIFMNASTNPLPSSAEANRASAKDFFLHLGAIVGLYTITISFLNLIFKIINRAFPEVNRNYYAWGGGSEISLPVATIIVAFPVFLVLSAFVYKLYNQNPEKKEMLVRKWLVYITLFVAGIILAVDLIMVLYRFLDGQDLTAAFLLKALSVLLVAGAVFGFYLQDIRDRISSRQKKWWAMSSGIVILASIIAGFAILGSPQTQRLIRLDNQKVEDLQNLQGQVINYWQVYGSVPETFPNTSVTDPQTRQPYEYKKTGEMTFELCAQFNKASAENPNHYPEYTESIVSPGKLIPMQNNNWEHTAGYTCFERIIDPIAYPTQIRG
jgi:hypothetical protein